MKIVHFISSLMVGGAETVLMALIRGLLVLGHEQEVVYLHTGPFVHELTTLRIPSHHLAMPGGCFNPCLWWKLGVLLCDLKPDVVHTSLWAANLMGRVVCPLIGVPVVAALHALPDHEGRVRNLLEGAVAHASGGTIAASVTIAHAMETAGLYRPGELQPIPSGVNSARLQQAAAQGTRVAYIKKPGAFVLGAVGRLVPVKQFDRLLRVFDRLVHADGEKYAHVELLIIGSGPEEAHLRSLITEYGLADRVTILTGQQSAPYYRSFDCFILPSVSEGLGLVVLEAMVFKVPVIVTGGATHEIVVHGINGLLVGPRDEQAWYQAIVRYIEDPALRTAGAPVGFETVTETFSEAVMVKKYEAAFERAASGRLGI
jgi:glycosyltransferase involved in cell wall biosynthesis